MPYTIRYLPVKGKPPWAKIAKRTGRIVSRHKTKKKAQAAIRAYYAAKHAHNADEDCHVCGVLLVNSTTPFVLNRNPLAADPTRTTMIRKRFMVDMNKRFMRLKAAVRKFLVEDDQLGLKEHTTRLILHQRDFQFHTDAGKLKAFNDWFRQQVEANVFYVPPSMSYGPWTAPYVESAYKRGMINAYLSSKEGKLMEAQGIGEQTQEQFLRSSFAAPETINKVQLLATRSFEQLKGVTAQMGSDMNRILAQGMVDGSGAEAIAKEMTDRIGSLSDSRALLIARTEIINAHAEGQLDAFEKLGVEEVGVKAEWSTAGDDRVCPECADMEGEVFDIDEARGMIPLHPNCVLGDSVIEGPDVLALTRVKYTGRIIHISTPKRRLSVTEHHVLLTRNGWRFAKDLRPGDQLIDARGIHTDLRQDPEENNGIPTISNAFEALAEIFPEHHRIISGAAPEDFHGDGGSMHEKIHVILADCKLRDQFQSSSFAEVKKFSFLWRNIRAGKPLLLDGKSMVSFLLKRLATSADGFMSSGSVPAILARRTPAHHKPIGFLRTSNNLSSVNETPSNGAPAFLSQSQPFSNFFDALPASIAAHDITGIKIQATLPLNPSATQAAPNYSPMEAEGSRNLFGSLSTAIKFENVVGVQVEMLSNLFVFDVWTHSSVYILNGMLSSNCRCAWIPSEPEK